MNPAARTLYCVLCAAVLPLRAAPLARPYTVENYDVSVRADVAAQRLYGTVEIRLHGRGDSDVSALEFDAGALKVTSVTEDGIPRSFDQDHGKLFVVLARPVHPDEQRTLTVTYEASPSAGLKFSSDQVVAFAVSDWMPCDDSSGERATLHLTLIAPSDAKAAASGQFISTHAGEGRTSTEWRLDSPTSPSRFGFALGTFGEATSEANDVKLRVLGAGAPVAATIGEAMHFMADRTGKPYAAASYTQVFVHGDTVAALAGLALLPEAWAQNIDKQPEHLRPLADAVAQQWFGIGIGTKDWSDLWLSTGVSGFFADAFLGQKLGKQAYEREMEHARLAWRQLVSEGKDRPLSNSDWTTPEDADGGIAEYEGTWFLYLADQLMGDAAFWKGIGIYAGDEWGKAASSADLQQAFDAANTGVVPGGKKSTTRANAEKPLDNLFDMWVYGVSNEVPKKKRR